MRGVIYARYSSSNQRDESIEGQIWENTACANKHGIEIVGTYIDRAVSAKTDNRPEFQRMIKDSAKKNFDVVIVWKLDRFSRSRYDSAHYKVILKKNGVRVISTTETISEGAEGIILESVLEGMAEYYTKDLSEKVTRGHTENALKCMFNGGSVPFGFATDSQKRYQFDPERGPLVTEMFRRYAAGESMTDIINDLNNKGVRTSKGKRLNKNSLTRIFILIIGAILENTGIRMLLPPKPFLRLCPKNCLTRLQNACAKTNTLLARRKPLSLIC